MTITIAAINKDTKFNIKFCRQHGRNILRIFVTLPIFLCPQVQRSVMISNKQDICKLSNELLKGPRLRILGNYERSRKSKKFILPMTTPRSKVPPFPEPTCLKCKHSPFPSPHAHNEKITGPIQRYLPYTTLPTTNQDF